MKKESIILILLVIAIFILNYSFLDSQLEKVFRNYEMGVVQRVIDGDTAIINNHSVRLLGINSPERGEKGYEEAKQFLSSKILDKKVKLVFGKRKFDRYKRILAYIFLKDENINLESVKEGYSNIYFPEGKTRFYDKFSRAWEICLERKINLCERSNNTCLKLRRWDIKEQRIVLKNECNKNLNLEGWSVKDEGRKKYSFLKKILLPGEELTLTAKDWKKDYVWTNSGDSIFIRDSEGKLVFWNSY